MWTAAIDGGGARQVASDGEDAENPTQTPDGRYVAYVVANSESSGGSLVVRPIDGSDPVFEIALENYSVQGQIQAGRCRWMPDGRRLLLEFERSANVESFGIAPDGKHIVVSTLDYYRTLKLAEGVTGCSSSRRIPSGWRSRSIFTGCSLPAAGATPPPRLTMGRLVV